MFLIQTLCRSSGTVLFLNNQLNSVKNPPLWKISPLLCTDRKQGGNFSLFGKFSKKSSLRMFWKAQKRSFKQFGGGRFLESRISKSEKFPPCCVPIDNKGEIFHRIELIVLDTPCAAGARSDGLRPSTSSSKFQKNSEERVSHVRKRHIEKSCRVVLLPAWNEPRFQGSVF